MFRRSFRSTSLALAGILIAIGGCAEAPSAPAARQFVTRAQQPRLDVSGSASALIDERGGVLQSPGGDRIVFPAGALPGPTQITITSDPTYLGVQLQPHGIQFPAGHEPQLVLNGAGSNLGAFRGVDVAYVDESGAVAEILPATSNGARVATSLHHFSGYMTIGH
jgi:hypothetical protein